MAERSAGKGALEKVAEVSEKINIIFIGVGAVYLLWNPAVGGILIVGNALLAIASNKVKHHARK